MRRAANDDLQLANKMRSCLAACREGRFGRNCQEQCVSNQGCRGLSFCLPDPYGCSCASGWSGPQCTLGTAAQTRAPNLHCTPTSPWGQLCCLQLASLPAGGACTPGQRPAWVPTQPVLPLGQAAHVCGGCDPHYPSQALSLHSHLG